MKKGSSLILLVFACSLCLILGVFIGRIHSRNFVALNANIDTIPASTQETFSDYRLNINVATKVQLMDLPGIGETIAQRIIDYRQTNGPFQTIDDLLYVEGIGDKKLESIAELIRVGD